jgi:hypothetical protein
VSPSGEFSNRLVIKQLVQITSYFLIIALALFIPAGRFGWSQVPRSLVNEFVQEVVGACRRNGSAMISVD